MAGGGAGSGAGGAWQGVRQGVGQRDVAGGVTGGVYASGTASWDTTAVSVGRRLAVRNTRALCPHLLNFHPTPTLAQPPSKCTRRPLWAPPLQPLPFHVPIPLVRPITLAPSPCPPPT